MWDNRFTLHIRINDSTAERRVMIRATALECGLRSICMAWIDSAPDFFGEKRL